jgi:Putative zinc-finger
MATNEKKGDEQGGDAAQHSPEDDLASSCKAAARLMSEARDRALSEHEKLNLDQHLAECRNCVRFDKQLDFLSELAKRYAAGNLPKP